ncbi:hypothetical protein [Paraconexibacter sp. AEG42_29]
MTFQRVCAWSGVVCVALFFTAFVVAGFVPPLSPNDSAEKIARHYREHQVAVQVGGLLMLLSGLFYAAFTAVVSAQMRRIPGVHRTVDYAQLAAGAFGCVTFLIPAMLFEVTAFRPERDPAMTQLLNDFSFIFLVMPWTPFLTQNWSFAFAILCDRRERPLFPRWLAYVNLWAPLIFSPSVLLPFFRTGPFSWRGLFVVWIPAIVFIAQFVVNTWMLLRAIRDEQDQQVIAADGAGSMDPRDAPALTA